MSANNTTSATSSHYDGSTIEPVTYSDSITGVTYIPSNEVEVVKIPKKISENVKLGLVPYRRTPKEIALRRIRKERKKKDYNVVNYRLKDDEIAVVHSDTGYTLLHSGESNISILQKYTPDGIMRISRNEYFIESGITFDKKGNIVSGETGYNNNPSDIITSIEPRNLRHIRKVNISPRKGFMIIDKKSFIESKGEVFKPKRRVNMTIQKAAFMYKNIKKAVKQALEFSKRLEEITSQVYDEETFEVLVSLGSTCDSRNMDWAINILFPDVSITNSYKRRHYLGDMVAGITGKKVLGTPDFYIDMYIHGHRVSYTNRDANRSYAHSHLNSGTPFFDSYCIGEGEIFDGISSMTPTDEELQGVLLGLDTFVKWESLEGGPYHTFSSVIAGSGVQGVKDDYSIINNLYDIRYIENIMKHISFSQIQSSFKLKKVDGETRYVLDEHEFIETMVPIIEPIVRSNRIYYYYDHNKEWFVKDRHGILRNTNETTSDSGFADNHVKLIPDTYINGRHIKAYHKEESGEIKRKEVKDHYTKSINPSLILQVGYTILYHLNKQLKDVKIKKQEEAVL